MKVIYAQQPLPKSIFLVGPTPRLKSVPTWRPRALEILRDLKFDGTVLVPETEDWGLYDDTYYPQVEWEWEGLAGATVIAAWVPRELKEMPAFTTNVEFGDACRSGKVILGFPVDAPKMRYLDSMSERFNIPVFHTLEDTLTAAVAKAARPYPLKGRRMVSI